MKLRPLVVLVAQHLQEGFRAVRNGRCGFFGQLCQVLPRHTWRLRQCTQGLPRGAGRVFPGAVGPRCSVFDLPDFFAPCQRQRLALGFDGLLNAGVFLRCIGR